MCAALVVAGLVGSINPSVASASPIEASPAGSEVNAAVHDVEVAVYGGTPAGVMAAVAAARRGASVMLVEPTLHVGGMMSNGLSWTDRGDVGVIGGLPDEFFDRVQAIEGVLRGRFAFQPATAESVFNAMLADAGVGTVRGDRLAEGGSVRKSGPRITSIRLASGTEVSADVFIDASYEGDVLHRAGVSYRVGREAAAEYGEPMAGVRPSIAVMNVPPGLDPGIPLSAPGPVGSGDGRIQSSNYRVCLSTDPANQVPFSPPTGYDPSSYDLVAEYLSQRMDRGAQPQLSWVMHVDRLVNNKWDLNETGAMSLGLPGGNYDYPDATEARRQQIREEHTRYQAGFLYFLVNDPRVPPELSAEVARFGLCADEFEDNGNWPRQLYLREGRRMLGEYVLTQQDVGAIRSKPDVIGLASYRLDAHLVSRWVDGAGVLRAEGGFLLGMTSRWAIPYRSLTPRRAQATNLLVPAASSASHVAHASLRMEPQFMIMGQAAGTAAAMAAATGIDVQDVPITSLQRSLRSVGAVLDDPGDIGSSTFYDEIVWAFGNDIIEPCGLAGHFCPNQAVTREMMAEFLAEALELPPARFDYFTDDDGSPSEDSINRVAEARITVGCSATAYCPAKSVTRAEMASFLSRAYELAPSHENHFTDDDALRSHHGNINRLATAGITTGCTTTTYCPHAWVTRGQMMAFLYRATFLLAGQAGAHSTGSSSTDDESSSAVPQPAEGESSAPAPSAEPVASVPPPTAAAPVALVPGPIAAETEYRADGFAVPFTFRATEEGTVEFVDDGREAFTLIGSSAALLFARPETIHVDPSLTDCLACSTEAPATVREWLDALEGQASLTIVASRELTAEGAVAAIQLDVQSVSVLGDQTGSDGPPAIFDAADRSWSLPPGESRILLFETAGGVIWVSLQATGTTFIDATERAQPMLDSIAFD